MLEPGLGMGSLTAEPTLLPAADTDVKPKLMESQEQWGMGLLPRSICLCLSLYSTSSFLEIKKKKTSIITSYLLGIIWGNFWLNHWKKNRSYAYKYFDTIGTNNELLLEMVNQNESIVTCYFSWKSNHLFGLIRTGLKMAYILQGHYWGQWLEMAFFFLTFLQT